MPKTNPVSRLDFLKLAGTAGTAFMLLPLVPLGRALAQTVPMPTKPKGFVWYMNHDEPFDSHFEIGGGSTYSKLVKNKDGSWTANDNERVKFNLNVNPTYEDAIAGCKMSFKDSMARGYTFDKSDLD